MKLFNGSVIEDVENITQAVDVGCFNFSWFGNVSLQTLANYSVDCNSTDLSQTAACYAAISAYCMQQHQLQGGLAQEVVNNDSIAIGCLNFTIFRNVSLQSLTPFNSDCNSTDRSQTAACYSAVFNYCGELYTDGGVPQLVFGNDTITVGCFSFGVFRSLPISTNSNSSNELTRDEL
jgi:hypothetical protein